MNKYVKSLYDPKIYTTWVGHNRYNIIIRKGIIRRVEKCEQLSPHELAPEEYDAIMYKLNTKGLTYVVNDDGELEIKKLRTK